MAAPRVSAFNCANCGAPVSLRSGERAVTVVCIQCLSVIDVRDPQLRILQKFEGAQRYRPLIPLGVRGKLRGGPYEAIGFQVREIVVDGEPYRWSEYLLFNPFKGYRYLTEYDGHWNFVTPLRALPQEKTVGGKRGAVFLGESFRHFQKATATTVFVMGEFPWRVSVGETAVVDDYISPPRLLSSERTENEVTWSMGEYTQAGDIWKGFQLSGSPPPARGIYANQPSPHAGRAGSIWTAALVLLVALAVLLFATSTGMSRAEVYRGRYAAGPETGGEKSFVTDVFELKGRPSNVEVTIETDVDNDWAYFSFALINEATGQAWDFGREVSYYHGRDSDGAWSEGDRNDRVIIPTVPAGRYYLRVEPEREPNKPGTVRYAIRIRRDVPSNAFFWIAAVLLLVPPVFVSLRSRSFEGRRWRESSYAE